MMIPVKFGKTIFTYNFKMADILANYPAEVFIANMPLTKNKR